MECAQRYPHRGWGDGACGERAGPQVDRGKGHRGRAASLTAALRRRSRRGGITMYGAGPLFVVVVVVLFLTNAIKLLREWERGVVLRLGKFQAVRGPGLIFIIPGIERLYKVNTRVITVDVPPQDVITKDNVTLKVSAVVFFHIFGPRETIINVEDWYSAT